MKQADISVDYIGHYGDDLTFVNAARVSFHKESTLDFSTSGDMDLGALRKEDKGLINYLAKHKHFSPFNHAFLSFRVKAPIFVARQLVKHKFMPWNEVSRRYVDDEPEFYIPVMRKRAENVKQGSSEEVVDVMYWDDAKGTAEGWFTAQCADCLSMYKQLLKAGAAPEVARCVLPQNMMTEWIWSGTLGAYADMLRLRLDPHTQYESRIVAEKVKEIITPLFPVSVPALLEIK